MNFERTAQYFSLTGIVFVVLVTVHRQATFQQRIDRELDSLKAALFNADTADSYNVSFFNDLDVWDESGRMPASYTVACTDSHGGIVFIRHRQGRHLVFVPDSPSSLYTAARNGTARTVKLTDYK